MKPLHLLTLLFSCLLLSCNSNVKQDDDRSKSALIFRLNQSDPYIPKTLRTCFHATRATKGQDVYLLAMGANTGKLMETNQDARNFKAAMQDRYRIPETNTCLLENVYLQEVKQAITRLGQVSKADDMIILYFSGHGTQVRDINGDEQFDNFDEVLVTYSPKKILKKGEIEINGILDDDFATWVNALPTDRVLTVLDTCFSGGMYLSDEGLETELPREKSLFNPDTLEDPLTQSSAVADDGFTSFERIKGLLLSAAEEDQEAIELPKKGGQFTVLFLQTLQQKPHATLADIFSAAADAVAHTKHAHYPIAVGDWSVLSGLDP